MLPNLSPSTLFLLPQASGTCQSWVCSRISVSGWYTQTKLLLYMHMKPRRTQAGILSAYQTVHAQAT